MIRSNAVFSPVGTWRSLVARTLGVREVAGSNPVVPTIFTVHLAESVITGAHWIFFSKDPDSDRAFFHDVLGLRAVDAGGGWLIFALPPAEAAFHPARTDFVQQDAGHLMRAAVLYLMCDNLSEQIKLLAKKDVVCSPVVKRRWGTRTGFRLPTGGEIGLYQPSHPTALGLG